MAKADAATVDARVHQVVKFLSIAKPTHEICRFAAEQWGVSRRQAERYIASARDIIREEYSVDRRDFMGRQLAVLDQVIQNSIKDGQNSNAIGALRLQAELTQLLGGRK